jgi:UDP-N-acetylmuramoyl-tripeptide--D-alanyl-D-alanine ligase
MSKEYLWNNSEIQRAISCKMHGTCYGNKLEFDSRKIEKGDIFVALRGNNTDGHSYVKEALSRGCGAALVEHLPTEVPHNNHLIEVNNVLSAVKDMAIFNRDRSKAKIIGITGSVGKTSTKEIVRHMLQRSRKIFYTSANFNGQIGIPMAVASMPEDTEFGIYEMGMSYAGEMTKISEIVKPDVAIITNIAGVHLENFGSIKEIAKAKAEIFKSMRRDGVVLLNRDNEYTPLLVEYAKECGLTKIYTFGVSKESDGYLQSYVVKDNIVNIEANICGEVVKFSTSICGEHQALNMVLALLLAKTLSVDLNEVSSNFQDLPRLKGRGAIYKLSVNKKQVTLVDESYNASPLSVKASLRSFSDFANNNSSVKRKVVLLGDMYELGPEAIDLHKGLLESLKFNSIDKVISVGDLMKELFAVLPEHTRLKHFKDYKEAMNEIDELLKHDDMLLVKGSNGTKLHEIVKYLERYAV